MNERERNQIEFIVDYIKNETNLEKGSDIQLISSENYEDMYDYFKSNPNKVQYAVAFCFDR